MTDTLDNFNGMEGSPGRKRRGRKAVLVTAVVLCVLVLLLSGAAVWGYMLSISDAAQTYLKAELNAVMPDKPACHLPQKGEG